VTAGSKEKLRELLNTDFRGLIVTTVQKFEGMEKNLNARENIIILVDEAHRSQEGNLANYMRGALPNAYYIGLTGTPIDRSNIGKGTFVVFGRHDPQGYLDKYSIKESIADGTTVPLYYTLAPQELRVDKELLEKEFFELVEREGTASIEELDKILDKAVRLKNFLKASNRVNKIAEYIANHFRELVEPLGLKAFIVAVDREGCALYKQAIDKYLPPEYSKVVFTQDQKDSDLLRQFHISEDEETNIRKSFRASDKPPKILIVTQKLLTGFDAPILYCMYLDKPLKDHTLLQAIARVNRPLSDEEGEKKTAGLIVDFVGILDNLKRALSFDSATIEGALTDLTVLKDKFADLMKEAQQYLAITEKGIDDKTLTAISEKFSDAKERERFFKLFKQVEEIYEILSPDVFLRDYLEAYKSLGQLYKVVQNMFRPKEADLYRDLRNKTKELIRKHVNLEAIMESLPAYKIDEKVIEKVERERLPERAKVVNLYRSIILHVQANVRRDHVANDPDNTKPENSNKRKILNWLLLALLGTATIGTAAVIGKYVTTNPEVKNVQTDKKRYLPGETVKITGSTSQAESIRAEVVGPGGFRQTPFLGLENSLFGLNFTTRADLEGLYNATLTADVNIVPFITKSSSLTTSIPVFDDPAISLNYSRVAKPGMEVPISIFARDTSDITRMLIEYGGTNVSIPFTPSNRVNASYILRLDNSEGDYGFRIFAFDKFGNVGVNGGSVTSRLTDLDRLVMLGLENGVSEQGVLSLYNSVPQLLELVKSDSGRESLVKFFKVAKSNPDIASQIADISYRDRSFPSIGFATKLAELSDDAIEIHYDKPSLRISRTTANAQGNVTLYTLISGLPQHSVEVRHLLGNATELDSDMVYNFRPMNYYTLAKHLGLSPEILQRPELLESFGDKIKAEDYLFYELLGQSISNQEIWQKRLALLDYQLGLPSDIRVIPLDKPSLVRKYPSRADREEISMNMWAPAEWAFIDGDGGRGAYSSTPSLQKVYKNIEKVVSGEWLQSYLQAYNNLSSELHRRVEQFLSEHTDPDNWAKLAEGWYSVAKMFKKYDTIQKTIPEINRLRFLYGLVGQDINVIEQDRAYATVVRAPAIGGSVSVARAPYPTGGGFHSEPVFPIPIEVLNIFLSDSTTYGKPIILKGQGISFIYCEEDSFISGYSSRPFLEQLSLPRRETYRRNF